MLIIKDIIITTWKGEIQNLTKHKLNTEFNFSFNIIMYLYVYMYYKRTGLAFFALKDAFLKWTSSSLNMRIYCFNFNQTYF